MVRTFKERIRHYLYSIAKDERKDYISRFIGYILLFLSLIYSRVLTLRFFLFKAMAGRNYSKPDDVKVISVGNITLGGTGKTPLVERIVEYLLAHNRKVAIISRGYKGTGTASGTIADEPEMLKKRFPSVPVIINPDRRKAVLEARKNFGCEYAILDDAFQNLGIVKALDIVCINAVNPFGNRRLLPRGIMRVPFLYLRNADICVLTHVDRVRDSNGIVDTIRKMNKQALVCTGRHVAQALLELREGKEKPLSSLLGKRVSLLCGIAAPKGFEETVYRLGADIVLRFYFDDHHFFTQEELDAVFRQCRSQSITTIITTAKDQPRLLSLGYNFSPEFEVLVLQVKLELENNETEFYNRIHNLFSA
ncbi:MAG: tetraacyldisaccharide 4'-kinase [Candidatus Omnitrophica bacterium]|nr:tetraacyldisaccharide 4'-kinase [Candidatus Omnitrophota bacterium]